MCKRTQKLKLVKRKVTFNYFCFLTKHKPTFYLCPKGSNNGKSFTREHILKHCKVPPRDCLGFRILVTRFWIPSTGFLNPRYWILDPRYWILDPMHWILNPRYWILDPRYWILDSRNWIPDPRYWILNPRYWILDSKYWIPGTGV